MGVEQNDINEDSNGSWLHYQRLVLFRLNEQDQKLNDIDEKVSSLQVSMALMKFKMSMIGAGAGALAAFVVEQAARLFKS